MSLRSYFFPSCAEGFELCQPEDPMNNDLVLSIPSQRRGNTLPSSINFRLIKKDRKRILSRSDAPWFMSGALLFREPAALAIAKRFPDEASFDAVSCGGDSVSLLRPNCMGPALDEKLSDVMRFDDGRIFHIDRCILDHGVINNKSIYLIANIAYCPVVFSDEFVSWWKAQGFCGIDFSPVSPSTVHGLEN